MFPFERLIKSDNWLCVAVSDSSDNSLFSMRTNVISGSNDNLLADLPIVIDTFNILKRDLSRSRICS